MRSHDKGSALRWPAVRLRSARRAIRYSPILSDENEEIADWLERLTANKRNWGFGLCFLYLRNVQGYGWNHKRVYRIYCAAGTKPADQAKETAEAGQA